MHDRISGLAPSRPTTGPYVAEIDPTTACNLACPECISGELLNQGSLEHTKLIQTIDDLAELGTRAVIFIGGGEPMTAPGFSELVRRVHGHGMAVGITTNGTLISRHLDAVSECASWTRVSVDAGNADTFAFFRPSRGNRLPLHHVVRQMEALAKVKRGALGYSFLLLKRDGRTNIEDMVEATRLAREIGCDYIECKPSMEMDHKLTIWTADELRRIRELIDECTELATGSFRVHMPVSMFHVFESADLTQPKDYSWCPATHMRTVITPSGCYACPYHRGRAEFRYGDVAKQSFRELWASGERAEMLERLSPDRDCRFHCIRHAQNEAVLSGVAAAEPTVGDYDPFI
ncbi:radical SAM protein [Amycolatopsis sp. A133]|uniref:radical SAM protein n=1 Tax=Amycolatopsis sp. A133 TaxID=3064472 RepID=UPI0027F5F948|nr:radical SAM protein [Amycolatopsis sp. A133]MDQ7803459.1 radical SAM protein [Amycolatopsis sp. A133]